MEVFCRHGQQIGLHHIINIGEIPGLFPIAKNDRRTTIEECIDKPRDDRRVDRGWILFGTKNIEISERDRFKAVELKKELAVLLSDIFLQGIGGKRVGRYLLSLRQGRGIAIDRRRGGIDDPFTPSSLAARRMFNVPSTLTELAVRGSSTDRWTDGRAA
jgi:hypothetical protein